MVKYDRTLFPTQQLALSIDVDIGRITGIDGPCVKSETEFQIMKRRSPKETQKENNNKKAKGPTGKVENLR